MYNEALKKGPKVVNSELNIEKIINKLWTQGFNFMFKKIKNQIEVDRKSAEESKLNKES